MEKRKGKKMGREIRKVVPNWKHPITENGDYQPMFDESFIEVAQEWIRNLLLWESGEQEDIKNDPELKKKYPFYWQWSNGPPDEKYYLPELKEEKTWVQMYETVSEGTPVTPPFATKAEILEYLIKNGDFWDQRRGSGGWKRENAERFLDTEYAPSMMMIRNQNECIIKQPRDGI